MNQSLAHHPEVRKRITKLQEFAAAVGLKLKREPQDDGSLDLVLYDKRSEALCTEFEINDMAESIGVYAGSNENYEIAKNEWELYA
jgi:hypothetical protein